MQSRAIHAALHREHGYAGSDPAVARIGRRLRGEQPPEVTVRLEWLPGEASQVDFSVRSAAGASP